MATFIISNIAQGIVIISLFPIIAFILIFIFQEPWACECNWPSNMRGAELKESIARCKQNSRENRWRRGIGLLIAAGLILLDIFLWGLI